MGLLLPEDTIFIVSDITAGALLVVLIFSVTVQASKHKGLPHLLAAEILVLAGVLTRISAKMMNMMPADFEWRTGANATTAAMTVTVFIISYALITLGITESVTYVIYINEDNSKSGLKLRYAVCMVFIAAGAVLFCLSDNINAFTALILAQFGYYWLYLSRNWSKGTRQKYMRASVFSISTFALALVFDGVRLTGLGLSMMFMILTEQYHEHTAMDLAEKEAALAKSKVQILSSQISPHYIYNSLQGISGLCGTDPEKAREAIDAFSDYLRGNLESLTDEELIPFTRELEHTKAYLELERLSGLRRFVAEYKLEVTDFMLPPLVLQPVVENAVQHGAAKAGAAPGAAETDEIADTETAKPGVTKITIATREDGRNIYIEVTDSTEVADEAAFAGGSAAEAYEKMPKTEKNSNKNKKSIGLDNVRTRLACQIDGSLDMKSTCSGTKVTMILPVPPDSAQ